MKNSILFSSFLVLFVFSGCFKDEGNYDYEQLNAPTWLIDVNADAIQVTCYEGKIAKFNGRDYFQWDEDSAIHEANVSYEWKLRDVVFGKEANFEIETDSLIKIIGDNPFRENGHSGLFKIIDKKRGIVFMAKLSLKIKSHYSLGNWLVLSVKGDNSKLSYVERKRRETTSDGTEVYYELIDDIFKKENGVDIPGKPLRLAKAIAKNIGSLGSTTIITDKVAYVVNNENMVKVSELKDEFLDIIPENLNVVDRHDCNYYTYLTTLDGRIFRRIMSKNYLGGKFLATPYAVDAKGYKVLTFGHSESNIKSVPCYDEKNRRVLRITFKNVVIYDPERQQFTLNTIAPVTKGVGSKENLPPVWEMPEGTEVLYLTRSTFMTIRGGELYTIIYNDSNGNTCMGDFALSADNVCLENKNTNTLSFPGGNLNKESLFLTSVHSKSPKSIVMYTKGNEIRYVDRNRDNVDYPFLSCDFKVTYIGYTTYYAVDQYQKLVVGLENGTLLFYEFYPENMQMLPKLLSSLNVGGKIVSAKELSHVYNGDAY